ncbi:SDR family oxidoreductase [Sulfurovum sp. NBC37-1]|uniref:SDR family oxidoreductase n=1 Tax=Sulfurovum sp. (strain NBC37-1) TaxID=387093 RepID=UPI0001587709|nr:SDR family oxidoreductase [Sulfurovum sp. NBC37-1]BAF71293.1 short-chain dehydrogenase/reductase SDR [Sulfurovum sp. NBC37-1]
MSYILIIGAKSDMARAIAREYAKNGYNLYLAARNVDELTEFAKDIITRTQREVDLVEFDVLNYTSHQAFYENLQEKPLGIISAVGYLGDQKKAQNDFSETQRIIDTNYTGIVSLFNIVATDFEKRRSGFMVGISSVAGDRGRKSNYIYGSAKAALTAYLSGLRNRLYDAQIQVLTVKPGFVATKMTENLDLPEKLTAQPEEVAKAIFSAQQRGKNVIYTKWVWKYIMMIIRAIPEWKFRSMDI